MIIFAVINLVGAACLAAYLHRQECRAHRFERRRASHIAQRRAHLYAPVWDRDLWHG